MPWALGIDRAAIARPHVHASTGLATARRSRRRLVRPVGLARLDGCRDALSKRPAAGRIVIGVVAVLALAWLAVMERDIRLRSQAVRMAASGHLSRAHADLSRARLLSPDTTPAVVWALIQAGNGDRSGAIRSLEDVVRGEPDNLMAWGDLLLLARGYDAAATRRGLAAVRRLDPLTAPPTSAGGGR
jgi:hypothetical protein